MSGPHSLKTTKLDALRGPFTTDGLPSDGKMAGVGMWSVMDRTVSLQNPYVEVLTLSTVNPEGSRWLMGVGVGCVGLGERLVAIST